MHKHNDKYAVLLGFESDTSTLPDYERNRNPAVSPIFPLYPLTQLVNVYTGIMISLNDFFLFRFLKSLTPFSF